MQNQTLEQYFARFRRHVVGREQPFETAFGTQRIVYADWTAGARLYGPIEDKIAHEFGPFVANTHTETNVTGTSMTLSYHEAQNIIKRHVHAGPDDVMLPVGTGMTAGIVKLQRMLGLKIPEQHRACCPFAEHERPVVFITHMEHHSNHTTWVETICDVAIIRPTDDGHVDLDNLRDMLSQFADRPLKIASVTACSNVTGIQPPYFEIARIMHEAGGICFVDFACSAPYVDVDMHPADPLCKLDAIFLSPHKFLGGPGSTGVLVFDGALYHLKSPDRPGGGTVSWTNAWNEMAYYDDIELREDGGTPGYLQTIRAALAMKLKEEMGVKNIIAREHEIIARVFACFDGIPALHVLQDNIRERMGVISFTMEDVHYNLVVKLLNDRYGIQTRGGCACAGTYGHYLFYIRRVASKNFTNRIDTGDLSKKPGWVRLSIHPTMTDDEIELICEAVRDIARNGLEWAADYTYDPLTNEWTHHDDPGFAGKQVSGWFSRVTPAEED
ncbi:MAG: aminotransferase class V-fold PLP-dependent enzyme [Candidatus Cloacimonetes bacterium]|nr:aminotransferase class V-fold PLP-dependent enzyme [Candidatus Cloacimonadota bacterium]